MSAGRKRDNGRPPHIDLTLFGISDAELLAIVDDLADEDGWTHTVDVRMQLGEKPEETENRSRSGVGPRLSWLKRYGWLEQHVDDRTCWRLTAVGHALLDNPELTRTVEQALAKLNPAQRLRLTRELGEAGAGSPDELRTALRRQWQRSLGIGRRMR
jgi:hypothetical protein